MGYLEQLKIFDTSLASIRWKDMLYTLIPSPQEES